MIYFVLLSIPLLLGPLRSLPYGRTFYRYFVPCYFLVLVLFSGLRWNTGTDWEAYRQYFLDRDNFYFFEIGYVWLTNFVKGLTDSYTAFLLIDSVLALIPIWFVLQIENGSDPISLAFFFSYYFTINYLGANRRIISIGICFLALWALKNRRHLVFLGLCLLSFCFHRSSLVFLFAWPIYNLKPRKDLYVILIAIAIVFQIANPFQNLQALLGGTGFVLLNKIAGYSDNHNLTADVNYGLQNAISITKRSILVILIWWGWSRQSEEKKTDYAGFLNIYMFSFVFYIMFTGTVELFKTLTVYFSIVELLLLPRALSCVNKGLRPIAYILLACLLFVQQYSALKPFWELYVPYRTVLLEDVR